MILLTKNETLAAKNADRKREVDEGVKLAMRVDSLRKAASDEEARLRLTRDAAIEEVHRQTNEAIAGRDVVLKEVEELEKRRQDALEPIEAEKEAAERIMVLNSIERTHLDDVEVVLNERESDVSKREEAAHKREEAVLLMETAKNNLLQGAQDDKKSTQDALYRAHEVERIANHEAELKSRLLEERETSVAYRELDIRNMLKSIETERQEIINARIQIQDQYKVLERTANELKRK